MSTIERPPVSPGDTERAKEALVVTLGADAVTDDAEALRDFRDPFWVWGSADFDASLAVAPTKTEQVQQVVRIANEHDGRAAGLRRARQPRCRDRRVLHASLRRIAGVGWRRPDPVVRRWHVCAQVTRATPGRDARR